jgi:Asp-tRNA(Asn)/Glu-tRNA(Gln) amidotransferase A subunit family amidase
MSAVALAQAIRSGAMSARDVMQQTLARIARLDEGLRACTRVMAEEALASAAQVDAQLCSGQSPGPLAGVPVVVKNLFDLAGMTTLAGAKSRLGAAPADEDATIVARLRSAGAIVVGTTNMDEFAYGFTTENAHFGTTRNPRNLGHLAGGSSGGSAAAVAAGLAHIGLGSDTNGSIRVPSAYCGVVGHMARHVEDLALAYDVMQGADPRDPACSHRATEPTLPALAMPSAGLRVGVLDGWFRQGLDAESLEVLDRVAHQLGAIGRLELEDADVARAAAFIITAAEGGNLHREALVTRPDVFDAACRDRLLAGLLVPASLLLQAQRFRRRFENAARQVFQDFDVLLAPATPSAALKVGQTLFDLGGRQVNARAHIGVFTQPLSFIGLPIVVAPVPRPGRLPIGVQLVAAPWQEHKALHAAALLERSGLCAAPVAS